MRPQRRKLSPSPRPWRAQSPTQSLPGAATPPGSPAASAPGTVDEVLAATPRVDHRYAEHRRLDRSQGRQDRRPRPQGLSRDHRPEEPAHPAVLAARRAGRLLGRDGLRQRGRRQDSQSRHRLDRRPQNPDRRSAGDADLGQWRGPHLQARHRGRRQVHVHDHRFGRELRQRGGDRTALRARSAPRQAERRRLFGAARRLRRRDRQRRSAGSHLRGDRKGYGQERSPSRATAAGSGSPTNTGARRSFPNRPRRSRPGSRPAEPFSRSTTRPISSARSRRSRRERRPKPRRASSPARRKCRQSTITPRSSASRNSI